MCDTGLGGLAVTYTTRYRVERLSEHLPIIDPRRLLKPVAATAALRQNVKHSLQTLHKHTVLKIVEPISDHFSVL